MVLGVLTTVALHFIAGIPVPALAGLMSGAVTSTPGLGAATQVLKDAGALPEAMAEASLGYAVAYPFGIVQDLADDDRRALGAAHPHRGRGSRL